MPTLFKNALLVLKPLSALFLFTAITSQTVYSQELTLDYGTRNLSDVIAADHYADELLSQMKPGDEVVLYQNGDQLPQQTEHLMLRMAQSGYRVQVQKITAEDLEIQIESLNQAPEFYQEIFNTSGNSNPGFFRSLTAKAKNFVRKAFGIPSLKNMSLWIKVPRSKDVQRADFKKSIVGATTGFATTAGAYVLTYVISGQTISPELLKPATAIAVWVAVNTYYFRSIAAIMNQGLDVEKTDNGWKTKPHFLFSWGSNFVRGMLTNTIMIAASGGLLAPFQPSAMERSLSNSAIGVPSRMEIDRWIAKKTPMLKDAEGKIIVQSGQWSESRAANINLLWNTGYGLAKSLHLVGKEVPVLRSMMNWVFNGMIALNAGMMLKDNWTRIQDQFATFLSKAKTNVDSQPYEGGKGLCNLLTIRRK